MSCIKILGAFNSFRNLSKKLIIVPRAPTIKPVTFTRSFKTGSYCLRRYKKGSKMGKEWSFSSSKKHTAETATETSNQPPPSFREKPAACVMHYVCAITVLAIKFGIFIIVLAPVIIFLSLMVLPVFVMLLLFRVLLFLGFGLSWLIFTLLMCFF